MSGADTRVLSCLRAALVSCLLVSWAGIPSGCKHTKEERLSKDTAALQKAEAILSKGRKADPADLKWVVSMTAGRNAVDWSECNKKARRMLAELSVARGDALEAVRQYTILGTKWPDCAVCPGLAVKAAERLKYSARNRMAFEALARAWPNAPDVAEAYARWLADNGMKKQAIAEYKRLLETPEVKADFMLAARIKVALGLLGSGSRQAEGNGEGGGSSQGDRAD